MTSRSDEVEAVDAVVVGGGAAGLNAAYQLTKRGVVPMLLEARGRTGGLIFGDDLGGIVVDLGAESFAKRGPYVATLCAELGLTTLDPSGRSWIWSHRDRGVAFPIPHGVLGIPTALDDPAVIDVLSRDGLARARADLAMDASVGADCLDLASLVRARLGQEVLDTFVTPIAGGVHSADPSRLSVEVVTPGLRQRLAAEGSLVRAAAAQRAAAPPGAIVSSVAGGLFRLTDALADRIRDAGGEIWTRALVTHVRRDAGHWLVTVDDALPADEPFRTGPPAGRPATIRTPRLVVALDGRAALSVLGGVPELELAGWTLPRGADLAAVDLAVDNPALDAGPRGSGLLVTPPAAGDRPRVRCKALTHYSIKWPWVRDRQRHHILRVSYQDPGEGGGEWTPTVADALRDASVLLGVELGADQLRGSRLLRFPGSLPPHTPEHRARVAALEDRVRALPGFGVAGAWVAGTGLAAVLPHAERAARRVGAATVDA